MPRATAPRYGTCSASRCSCTDAPLRGRLHRRGAEQLWLRGALAQRAELIGEAHVLLHPKARLHLVAEEVRHRGRRQRVDAASRLSRRQAQPMWLLHDDGRVHAELRLHVDGLALEALPGRRLDAEAFEVVEVRTE